MRSKPAQFALRTVFAGLLFSSCWGAFAEPSVASKSQLTWRTTPADNSSQSAPTAHADVPLYRATSPTGYAYNPTYYSSSTGTGLNKHQLTGGGSLIGWKISDTLYFGRAKKDRAAVSFIWRPSQEQQVSLSTSGLKFTRSIN